MVQLQVVTVGETEHRSLHVGSPRCTVTAEGDFVEQVEIGGSFAETAYRTVKTEMVSVKCFAGIPPCLESSRPAVGIDGVVTVLPRVEDDRIAFKSQSPLRSYGKLYTKIYRTETKVEGVPLDCSFLSHRDVCNSKNSHQRN